MLRARAGWGFAAAGSPPRCDADDAPLDVVGATGLLAGRPFMARGLDELTLAGNGRFSSPEASTTSRETTLSTLVSEASTCSTSGSPGGEHAQILSARARRELERDLRRVHARINESAAAKEASDKMRAYVASKRNNAMRVMAKRGALVAPNARRIGDDDPDAIRRAAARALAAGVRRATPESSAELLRARGDPRAFGSGRDGDADRREGLKIKNAGDEKENVGVDAGGKTQRRGRRSMVGQRPPAPPSLTFARGGFGGRPPAVPRAKGSRFERPAKDVFLSIKNDEDDDKENVAETSASSSFASSFAFARFVPRTRREASTCDRGVAEGSPGASAADREPRLEVRGAKQFAKAVARRARRADGVVAALGARDEDGETVPRPRKNVDAPSSPNSPATSRTPRSPSKENTKEKRLPTLARGIGKGSFAFASASRSTSPFGFGVPSFDDDDGFFWAPGDEAETEESDCEHPGEVSYDFPSPAPSAAAAFIGLARTSPASAYSAYSEGSAPPTPPQFVLKGGFSELEHALYSGATVAFCGGGGERSFSAGGGSKGFEQRRENASTRDPDPDPDPDTLAKKNPTSFERRSFDAPTFGAGGFTNASFPAARDALGGGRSRSDSDADSDDDSDFRAAEDSFDGFEGLRTPGLPDFAPTRFASIETPPASAEGAKSLSPRSAAIRAETENGMATRIQAAFRGMRARRRRDALLSSSERYR